MQKLSLKIGIIAFLTFEAWGIIPTPIKTLWQSTLEQSSVNFSRCIIPWIAQRDYFFAVERQAFRLLHNCRQTHQFLMRLYADKTHNALVWCNGDAAYAQGLPSLLMYWKESGQACQYQFYELYADTLSLMIVQIINAAYTQQNTAAHTMYVIQAGKLITELSMITHKIFAYSSYEQKYARALKRYENLLTFLQSLTRQ